MNQPNIRPGFQARHLTRAFVLGVAAGAFVMLFTAPESGVEARRKLAAYVQRPKELAEQVPVAIREARTAAKQAFSAAMGEKHERPQ
jgi:gas vesicle protein